MAKKRKKSATKRISAALTRWMKKQNPAKMRGVSRVRVRKLRGGGVTITPVQENAGRYIRRYGTKAVGERGSLVRRRNRRRRR